MKLCYVDGQEHFDEQKIANFMYLHEMLVK